MHEDIEVFEDVFCHCSGEVVKVLRIQSLRDCLTAKFWALVSQVRFGTFAALYLCPESEQTSFVSTNMNNVASEFEFADAKWTSPSTDKKIQVFLTYLCKDHYLLIGK